MLARVATQTRNGEAPRSQRGLSVLPARRWVWASLGGIHLLLMSLGAMRADLKNPAFTQFYDFYGWLTGASQAYNYFAPEIGSELRARLEIRGPGPELRHDTLSPGMSREAQLRLNGIVGELGQAIAQPEERQAISAVWAARSFQKYPDAATVTVVLESFRLPSLVEYRRGERTGWDPFYSGTFSRKARHAE